MLWLIPGITLQLALCTKRKILYLKAWHQAAIYKGFHPSANFRTQLRRFLSFVMAPAAVNCDDPSSVKHCVSKSYCLLTTHGVKNQKNIHVLMIYCLYELCPCCTREQQHIFKGKVRQYVLCVMPVTLTAVGFSAPVDIASTLCLVPISTGLLHQKAYKRIQHELSFGYPSVEMEINTKLSHSTASVPRRRQSSLTFRQIRPRDGTDRMNYSVSSQLCPQR